MSNSKMKLALTTIAAAGMLVTTPVLSDDCCNFCCDPCASWCDGFTVGVDYLLWEPCLDDLEYAVSSTATIVGNVPSTQRIDRHSLCFDYESGVRAYFVKKNAWCDWDLMASYTWIHPTESSSVSSTVADALQPVAWAHGALTDAGGYSLIKSNLSLCYQSFDLLFAKEMCCGQCQSFTPFFGIEGMWADQHRNYKGNGLTTNFVTTRNWDSDFFGIGLKLGAHYNYELCDCFSFFAKGSATLLTGWHCASDLYLHNAAGTITAFNVHDKNDDCICVPGYHIAVGFNYTDCWCGYDFGLRLGYEFLNWYNMAVLPRYTNDSGVEQRLQTPQRFGGHLGFHGLFAGLNFSF